MLLAASSVAASLAAALGRGGRRFFLPTWRNLSAWACRRRPNAGRAGRAARVGWRAFRAWAPSGCGIAPCVCFSAKIPPRTHWLPACTLQSACVHRCAPPVRCARFCRHRQTAFVFRCFQIPWHRAVDVFSAKSETVYIKARFGLCADNRRLFQSSSTPVCR